MVFEAAESPPVVKLNTDVQIVRIVVIGLPGSGKSTFIKSLSQSTVWDGANTDSWFSGQLEVDKNLIVYFMEPPQMAEFNFIWLRDLVAETDADGYIVLMDSTNTEWFGGAVSIIQTIRVHHPDTPIVTATTHQDHPQAWSSEDIRLGLNFPAEIPVMPCISSQRKMVKEVVLKLLYRIFDVKESASPNP